MLAMLTAFICQTWHLKELSDESKCGKSYLNRKKQWQRHFLRIGLVFLGMIQVEMNKCSYREPIMLF